VRLDSPISEFIFDRQYLAQCFTTCEVSNSAKSSDFGADGFTASLSDWHELLQLTAPDDTCGLVFLRGQFPNSPQAILARAQRRDDTGSKGTFGTRLQYAELDSDLELGERRAQGWVNFRWPYTQYELKRRGEKWDEHTGTCEEISFVRDGTVFQLMRLKWGRGSSLSDYSDSVDSQEKQTVRLKAGGIIQFGCPCSNGGPSNIDTFRLNVINDGGTGLNCVSDRYQKRLEMQLFVNGIQQNVSMPVHGLDGDELIGTEVNTSSMHRIELSVGEPTYIISTYALRNSKEAHHAISIDRFLDLQGHLGIANTSVNMTDRLWTALCSTNYEASEAVEFCVVGRCVEQILGVSSIPFATLPVSKRSSAYEDERSQNAPEATQEAFETALLCNIITPQYVDVQSALYGSPSSHGILAHLSSASRSACLSKFMISSVLVILNPTSWKGSGPWEIYEILTF
jgi:hypothetical protein